MTNTIQQLEDLKEWAQDSARYERRLNFRGGQLVQPRQGFYKKGFVKPNRLTKEEIDQRYKAKKLKENPNYKAEADRRWKEKKLRENPDWTPYKAGTHYRKRVEAGKKDLIYDKETKKFRKAKPVGFQKTYHKFEAADKKLIKDWRKTLTDAAKGGDMSQTTGFQDWLTKKFDRKTVNTIRARTRLQLGFFSGQEYNNAQEKFVKSLIKKHNESDKLLHTKEDIWRKARFDKKSDMGKRMWKLMDDPKTGLENLDIKINKAVDNIIDNNLPIKTSSKVGRHISQYSPIIQMISEMSGAGSTSTIQNALLQNPKFKDKEFLETFRYLNRAHAKDFVGLPFDEALEYAKMRQGGLDVKGMLSYTTRYQNPESNIMNFAVRHANRHFRDGTKSQVQFYKLRADGTKGALMSWDKLPKNRDGNRVLDLKKVGFEYKNQFFHKNNLKTKGYRSGLFDEVYAMSGKNRLLVPDPNDPSQKITLKKLLQTTGDKLTVGHDEALGGVKGSPFKSLRLQGEKLNSALFNAYDKIQNKDLRARVLHSLEGQFKGLSGDDYQKAFIEGKTKEAQDIINKKIDVSKRGTLYREAGREIVEDPAFKTFSPKKQREALRIAGDKIMQSYQANGIGTNCKAYGGRVGFQEAGAVGVSQCMRNAINEHKRKLADNDPTALKKQLKINQTKSMKNILNVGSRGLRGLTNIIGGKIGAAIEVAVEAGFYGYGRQQGESHEQARENLFLPKVLEKMVPDVIKDTELWKKYGIKPFKTGVWEGPEKLIEEELLAGNESAQEYAQGIKALEDEYANASKIDFELGIMKNPRRPAAPEDIEIKEQELRDSYGRIEELQINIKEGTPAHDAYVAAQEKQKALQDERAQDYYGDSPAYRGSKQRQWQDEFLDYRGADRKYRKEQPFAFKGGLEGSITGPNQFIDWDAYADYGWDKPEQKWKDIYDTGGWDLTDKIGIAGGVANMAGGGIAGIRRPWAVPPVSGPVPQGGGLSSQYNRVKKLTE